MAEKKRSSNKDDQVALEDLEIEQKKADEVKAGFMLPDGTKITMEASPPTAQGGTSSARD